MTVIQSILIILHFDRSLICLPHRVVKSLLPYEQSGWYVTVGWQRPSVQRFLHRVAPVRLDRSRTGAGMEHGKVDRSKMLACRGRRGERCTGVKRGELCSTCAVHRRDMFQYRSCFGQIHFLYSATDTLSKTIFSIASNHPHDGKYSSYRSNLDATLLFSASGVPGN